MILIYVRFYNFRADHFRNLHKLQFNQKIIIPLAIDVGGKCTPLKKKVPLLELTPRYSDCKSGVVSAFISAS